MIASEPTVVIVPGLRDHVANHWQTILAEQLPNSITVPRMERNKLCCAAWVTQIDQTLAAVRGPIVLVAHSGGVMMTAHWARKASRPILGALLAAPADLESPLPAGYPTMETLRQNGWLPVPREPLPFPSIVATSSNDPLAQYGRVVRLAASWGSQVVDIGAVGHLNPASGFGEWPQAHDFIRELNG